MSQDTTLNRITEESECKIFMSLPILFICSFGKGFSAIDNDKELLVLKRGPHLPLPNVELIAIEAGDTAEFLV